LIILRDIIACTDWTVRVAACPTCTSNGTAAHDERADPHNGTFGHERCNARAQSS